MESLLKALQSNLGITGPLLRDPSTVAGLLALARAWQEGEVETVELLQGVDELALRAEIAARETASDLAGSLDGELFEALEGLHQSLLRVGDELSVLRQRVEIDAAAADEPLEALRGINQDISAHRQILEQWMRAPVARCPRCGSSAPEAVCQPCGLDRLIPDPEPPQEIRTAVLGPEYLAVYQAYRAVMEGTAPLSRLLLVLTPLEATLATLGRLAQARAHPLLGEDALTCLSGVEQIRRAQSTRAMRDLNQGWQQVFRGAVGLSQRLPDLLRQAGRADEASQLELRQRSQDGLSFDL